MDERNLHKESWDINARLKSLALTREVLIDTVRVSVGARAGCTHDDPPSARGYEPWRFGVRHLRERLQNEGWKKDDVGQFSTIAHDGLRIRIAVCNTDGGTAAENRVPRNRSRKGVFSERAADRNAQPYLFPEMNADKPIDRQDYTTWYLCMFITDDCVRAELSCPSAFESGYFKSYSERIFLISGDDWHSLDFEKQDSDPGEPNLEINISRK